LSTSINIVGVPYSDVHLKTRATRVSIFQQLKMGEKSNTSNIANGFQPRNISISYSVIVQLRVFKLLMVIVTRS